MKDKAAESADKPLARTKKNKNTYIWTMVFTVDGNMHSEHVALTREKRLVFFGEKIQFCD